MEVYYLLDLIIKHLRKVAKLLPCLLGTNPFGAQCRGLDYSRLEHFEWVMDFWYRKLLDVQCTMWNQHQKKQHHTKVCGLMRALMH